MVIGARILDRLKTLGLTQTELARRVGMSQGSIANLIAGRSAGSRHLHSIARELETTVDFLTGRIDDPSEGAVAPPTADVVAEQLDAVMIREIEVGYAMGAGAVIDDFVTEKAVPISRSWLRGLTTAPPEKIVVARGRGDSMMPTILDGDLCFIDLSKTTLDDQDRIWALAYAGFGMIKRLRQLADGSLQINSDNASVSPQLAYDSEAYLVGRVVGVLRKI